MRKVIPLLIFLILAVSAVAATQDSAKLTQIIDRVLAIDRAQNEFIKDITFDVASYEKSVGSDGKVKETKKYLKRVYMKRLEGGKYGYHEDYLDYYIDGVRQDSKDLDKMAQEKAEKKKKRGGKDIAFDMFAPLKPENSSLYIVTYEEISPKAVDGVTCYLVRAAADSTSAPEGVLDTLVNCLYYIDTASYHIVLAEFAPAKLVSKFMFKMSTLDMSINYEPYSDSLWLPYRFHIRGKAKAMYFMGINFEGEEDYTNPVINADISDSLFQ